MVSTRASIAARRGALDELAGQAAVAIDEDLHPARPGAELAASSSIVQVEAWLRQKAVPAAAAARAAAISPPGQNRPDSPVGPIITGSARRRPNSSTERSRDRPRREAAAEAIRTARRRASLRRSVYSFSAPAIGEVEHRARQGALRHGPDGCETVGGTMPGRRCGCHREMNAMLSIARPGKQHIAAILRTSARPNRGSCR